MSWAKPYKEILRSGKQVTFRPRGNSMRPHIESGQQVTVSPYPDNETPAVGDIVLATVSGADYLHFVRAVRPGQVQIANARGFVNGWTSVSKVYGKVIEK
jgi:hypothetical protein